MSSKAQGSLLAHFAHRKITLLPSCIGVQCCFTSSTLNQGTRRILSMRPFVGLCASARTQWIRAHQHHGMISLDEDLARQADATGLIKPDARRKFLQDHFGDRMMGRSFCITDQGLIGMGSGYVTVGDFVIVPFGCSTPILLRPEGRSDEYRYVGDVYIDRYMHGEAIEEMDAGKTNRVVSKYVLC
jgi:hypothetical protein